MRIPAFVLGCVVLLWGWQNQALAFAIPIAIVLEFARWAPWRWEFSDADFNRLADVSSVGFVLLAVYQFDTHSIRGIYHILRWLPAVLVLIVAGQLYSTRGGVGYSALFLSVRRAVARGTVTNPGSVDMTKPFLVVCLVSAAAGPERGPTFFIATSLLLVSILWTNRPRRYAAGIWATLVVAALGVGFINQLGVLQVRRVLEPIVMGYFRDHIWIYRDPYRAYTAMGQIGRLKLSDRKVLRVRSEHPWPVPSLLREASYRIFSHNVWIAGKAEFDPLTPDTEGTSWRIDTPDAPGRRVTIGAYLRRGKGLLSIPNGTFQVDDLPVEDLYRNQLGVLKVLKGPSLVEYRAHYSPARSYESEPTPTDLNISSTVDEVIREYAERLGLVGLESSLAVARLRSYFDQFEYSLVLRPSRPEVPPIESFLRDTRTGHCEYFATATVLLLRAAGIPARYATGYSVQEYSEVEESYVVRRRHAHSWALAYIDGRWRDIDTTPAVWGALEAAQAPWWEPGYDVWSWLVYQYSRWRWGTTDEDSTAYLLLLILPLLVVLAWRLYGSERVSPERGPGGRGPGRFPGLDSELFDVERRLTHLGLGRTPGESLGRWLARLDAAGDIPDASALRRRLLPVHYRYRFDPDGVAPNDRMRLRNGAHEWLSRHFPLKT